MKETKAADLFMSKFLKNDFKITFFHNIARFKAFYDKAMAGDNQVPPALIIAKIILNDDDSLKFFTDDFFEKINEKIPFIVVSSDVNIDSLHPYFKGGTNDYIIKPFKKKELLAKVKAILKKTNFGKAINSIVNIDGVTIEGLTDKQKKFIMLFNTQLDRTLERHFILDKIWGNISIHPKTLDVHLYNLRRKLSPYGFIIKSLGGGRWKLLKARK